MNITEATAVNRLLDALFVREHDGSRKAKREARRSAPNDVDVRDAAAIAAGAAQKALGAGWSPEQVSKASRRSHVARKRAELPKLAPGRERGLEVLLEHDGAGTSSKTWAVEGGVHFQVAQWLAEQGYATLNGTALKLTRKGRRLAEQVRAAS